MKIPNKRELQEIAFDHSSDILFQDFTNLYKRSTVELYSFLVINAILSSDKFLALQKDSFRNNRKGNHDN